MRYTPASVSLATALAAALILSAGAASADEIDDRVRAQFLQTTPELCFDAQAAEPDIYNLTYRDAYDGAPEQALRLYRFFCFSGAYNVVHVYFTYTDFVGVQQVFFAVPDFETRCTAGGPDPLDCKATTITTLGMTTVGELVNSAFDPATRTVESRSCWRGLCDASDHGVWVFAGGRFVLKSYEVDATYDGAVNPERIADFTR